jgi:hydro-lyases, Fe-S type, tartrate/fumarate subfamily, beta region
MLSCKSPCEQDIIISLITFLDIKSERYASEMDKYITTPLITEKVEELQAGDYVYITGIIYTARDAAHKRMYDTMKEGNEIPFNLRDNIIYYLGPTPEREGQVIGSAGPTTSSRMDKYTPLLLDNGLKGMIGKGKRNKDVIDSMIKNKSVYFAAVGGAGALLSKRIKASKVIAYDDLGTEAIRELYVENFPVIVVIDSKGNNLYEIVMQNC